MSKNWTHDLPIFKGAFERGNQVWKEQIEHILLSVRWGKSWNLLRKLAFFILSWVRIELMTSQSLRVLSKGEIKDVKEQKEHLALGHMSKNVKSSEIFEVENWGKTRFWGLGGKGGVGGGRHLFRGHHSESQQNFSFSGLMSKNVIVSEIINSQKSTETVKHRNFRISIKNFLLDFFWTQRSQNPKKTKKWVFQNLTHFLPRQANALGKCPFALK